MGFSHKEIIKRLYGQIINEYLHYGVINDIRIKYEFVIDFHKKFFHPPLESKKLMSWEELEKILHSIRTLIESLAVGVYYNKKNEADWYVSDIIRTVINNLLVDE